MSSFEKPFKYTAVIIYVTSTLMANNLDSGGERLKGKTLAVLPFTPENAWVLTIC